MPHMPNLEDVINAGDYGLDPTGTVDCRADLQDALDDVKTVGGRILVIPTGTYIVGRNSTTGYSLNLDGASDLRIIGWGGPVWLKHPSGMPDASVAILRFGSCSRITIKDVGFDGNWGNAVTKLIATSDAVALPAATIYVESTADFPSSGTILVASTSGFQSVTYTGKTTTTFTGCSGGTGTMLYGGTVGYLDAITGINHTTQTDPKNYGIMVRGGEDITIQGCRFKDIYGDCIWVGADASSADVYRRGARTVRIVDCDGDVAARSGIAVAQKANDIYVDRCRWTNIYASAFDTEPVEQGVYGVTCHASHFGGWFNPANVDRSGNIAMTIAGGKVVAPAEGNLARGYSIRDCSFEGAILIQDAADVQIIGNSIVLDWAGYSYAPITAQMVTDDVVIEGNYIYDRTTVAPGGGLAHDASIQVQYYANSNTILQPKSVRVAGNHIYARNGRHGIKIEGTGSRGYGSSALQVGETNTATSITGTTLVRTGAGWTASQWIGYSVRVGDVHATVVSNTSDTLTLWPEIQYARAWRSPTGKVAATPAAGTYTIYQPSGMVTVEANHIDCTNDGYGAGGFGIYAYAARAGMRARIVGNQILNAGTDGINIKCTDANRTWQHLEIVDNYVWDEQLTPTCTSVIRFQSPVHISKLVMRGNVRGEGVTTAVSGLTTGTWLEEDGIITRWAGYGSPEGVVTAPVGSTFRRLDGGASTCSYTKESGTGNTGWVAK